MARALVLVFGIAACSPTDTEVCKTSPPVQTSVVQLTAGANFTCAVLASGAARCWGYNRFGQLGLNHVEDIGDDETPASAGYVPIGGPVRSISAGYYHACAVLESGAVRCWGAGGHGELGHGNNHSIGDGIQWLDGTRDLSIIEAGDVPLGGSAVQVVAGFAHSCALLDTGAVRCWGSNIAGELGYGAPVPPLATPAALGDVPLGGTAVKLAAGEFHTCAIMTTGALRCWGSARVGLGEAGQLGYGNMNNIGDDETPASVGDVPLGAHVVDVTGGYSHTCALLETGIVRCWGHADLGFGERRDVGDDETPASSPDVVLGGTAIAVSAGGRHTCAVLQGGAVRCWGETPDRLGYGDGALHAPTPAAAGDLDLGGAAIAVAAGDDHTCAVLDTGAVRCWGKAGLADNQPSGQLGYGNLDDVGDDETPACAGDVPIE